MLATVYDESFSLCYFLLLPVFTITAMDGLGNRKRRGGDSFEIGVMGPAVLHGALFSLLM